MKAPSSTYLLSSTSSKPSNPRSGTTYFATVSPFNNIRPSKSSTCVASPFSFSLHKPGEVADGFTSNTKTTSAYCAQGPTRISIPCLREALYSLDMKMAMLMSQREELEFHLEQAVRLQSPVQRLPSELLSSIFVTAVLGIDDSDSVMVSTLMLVCRYWADVALNTPVLWSTILVSTHDSLVKARRKLARSKSVPLDITINFSPRVEHSSGVTENVIHAMDLIRPALWRTKSFRLSVPSRSQAYAALSRCQEDAPLLENLSIRIFHSIQEDHYTTPPLSLFNCHTPRLRSCSFTSFNFGWNVKFVSRLRILKLGGYYNGFSPSVDTLIDILRECPELEEFALRNMSDVELDVCSVSEEEIDPPKVLRLRRLLKASFYYAGVARTRMLLGQISFPALETLEFCYLDNLTPILHHLRTQSLTSLPLRALRIESSFFDELKFVKLLCRLPSLVTLELVDVEDASSNLLKVGYLVKMPARCLHVLYLFAGSRDSTCCSTLDLPETYLPRLRWLHYP
jgi:hypothetical protein